MKYTRKDLLSQEEFFEGEPEEIIFLIKLLEANANEDVRLVFDDTIGELVLDIELGDE